MLRINELRISKLVNGSKYRVVIPGLPPDREIEFEIELALGTGPIFQAPYCMALAELKELHEQL